MSLEDYNFYNDSRVRAGAEPAWYRSIDESTMTVDVALSVAGHDDIEEIVTFPIRFDVCSLCRGKGTHVNPAIDAGGLSREELFGQVGDDSAPSFADEYFSGLYDVRCFGCKGKRVQPQIDEDRLDDAGREALVRLAGQREEQAEHDALVRMERSSGA